MLKNSNHYLKEIPPAVEARSPAGRMESTVEWLVRAVVSVCLFFKLNLLQIFKIRNVILQGVIDN